MAIVNRPLVRFALPAIAYMPFTNESLGSAHVRTVPSTSRPTSVGRELPRGKGARREGEDPTRLPHVDCQGSGTSYLPRQPGEKGLGQGEHLSSSLALHQSEAREVFQHGRREARAGTGATGVEADPDRSRFCERSTW